MIRARLVRSWTPRTLRLRDRITLGAVTAPLRALDRSSGGGVESDFWKIHDFRINFESVQARQLKKKKKKKKKKKI